MRVDLVQARLNRRTGAVANGASVLHHRCWVFFAELPAAQRNGFSIGKNLDVLCRVAERARKRICYMLCNKKWKIVDGGEIASTYSLDHSRLTSWLAQDPYDKYPKRNVINRAKCFAADPRTMRLPIVEYTLSQVPMDMLYLIFGCLRLKDIFKVMRAVGIKSESKYLRARFLKPILVEYPKNTASREMYSHEVSLNRARG